MLPGPVSDRSRSAEANAGQELRVALLSPCFWPEVRRGAERIAAELAQGLLARGHRPRLITSHPGLPSRTVEDGLPIVRWWRPPDGRLLRRDFEDYLTHAPFTYLSLRTGDDDVAHAVYQADAYAALRWSKATGRPAVMTYMGIPERQALVRRRLRLEIVEQVVRGCTVVALSRMVADAFWRELGVEARVIHPGVDLRSFAPADRRAEEPTIFCAAPPEVERKRVPMLVAAFRRVRRERPTAELRLMRPGVPELARELEAEPGVSLVEVVQEPAALAPEYARAWVSALPSTHEAFGVVLLESLACGTPVVGTDAGAFPEIIDSDEVGRLFEGGEEELARSLLEALELTEGGATDACRDRAEEFSTDRSTERYIELYRELLAS